MNSRCSFIRLLLTDAPDDSDRRTHPDLTAQIVEKAKALGASLAGITGVAPLKDSPSYEIYDKSPYYEGYERVEWPVEDKSMLLLAVVGDDYCTFTLWSSRSNCHEPSQSHWERG
jgi:hypothetical protein